MTDSTIQQKVPVSIQDELRTSYLDYAMSVIIGRALPDVRDGLKPVHRRILFSMFEQGITAASAYKKCARVVGDVLGKYHPHGDVAVYDAMVRMAQEFSLRVPLVDGQGNYGSIDGDGAAAMRYTEARLTAIAGELLADLDKDTVDFAPNYDDSEREPKVLPAKFPQLLVNGAGGIAVGMATNIPPHNLREVVDATIALMEDPAIDVLELNRIVLGPDFPTGGIIYGKSGILQAYHTGRGSVMMRGRTHTEPIRGSNDREQIIVTEVPYQCNKARLVGRIAELVKEKRIEGISEIRDESDRDGIRVAIELKKDVFPQVVLNHLYRLTALQSTFGVNSVAIVNGKPELLPLKSMLEHFVDHRREVVRRRCRYLLNKAAARKEIVEGLGMATTHIDRVVDTIRSSPNVDQARSRLMELELSGLGEFLRRAGRPDSECQAADQRPAYRLSEKQARAILDMRLGRLTGLEREKLAAEYGSLVEEITRLRAILEDEGLLMKVIVDELLEVRAKYGEDRRTEIVASEVEIHIEDLIQQEDMAVAISHAGYIKRTSISTYRAQRRGGRGRRGMKAREEDWVKELFIASTHSYVFFFSSLGKLYVKKVYEIPEAAASGRGRAIVNLLGMAEGEKVAAITPVIGFEPDRYIVTLTRQGQIKKTAVTEYRNYRASGIIGVRIDDDDELLAAAVTDGSMECLVGTRQGMAIRFAETAVRRTGRATRGVRAIDLADGDEVVGLGVYRADSDRDRLLTVCALGYGKRTAIERFPLQNRAGKGVIMIDASDRNGPVVGLAMVHESDELIVITDRGLTLRTKVAEIRETGRNAQGVSIMRVAEGERIVAIESYAEGDEEDNVAAVGEASTEDAEPPGESPIVDGSSADPATTGTDELAPDREPDDSPA